jgi:Transposase DDE domain group 1
MGDPTGEADQDALRLDFDRRLRLQFRGSSITSDAGLLAYRELDDTLRLTDTGAETLADTRSGKNGRHRLAGLLRQSVFGRLAGYEFRRLRPSRHRILVTVDRGIASWRAIAGELRRCRRSLSMSTTFSGAVKLHPGPRLGSLTVGNHQFPKSAPDEQPSEQSQLGLTNRMGALAGLDRLQVVKGVSPRDVAVIVDAELDGRADFAFID